MLLPISDNQFMIERNEFSSLSYESLDFGLKVCHVRIIVSVCTLRE